MTSPADLPRAALVTGGTKGIGLAIARRLASEGFAVTLASRDLGHVTDAADGFTTPVLALEADAGDEESVAELVEAHRLRWGRLDALVLSAGMGFASPLVETPLRRVDRHYRLNVRGAFAAVSAALPLLRGTAALDPRGSRIIALSSLAGVMTEPGLAAYSATKAALISLCEAVCLEEGAAGVSATAICPGYVDTEMAAWKHAEINPADMIRVDDIAELAVSLTRLSRAAAVPVLAVHRAAGGMRRA